MSGLSHGPGVRSESMAADYTLTQCGAPRSWPPSVRPPGGPRPSCGRPAPGPPAGAGVDVVRLNFSHGTPEEHLAVLRAVREIAEAQDRPIAVLQDLSGPKIRTGRLRGDQPVTLVDGSRIVITTDETVEGSA